MFAPSVVALVFYKLNAELSVVGVITEQDVLSVVATVSLAAKGFLETSYRSQCARTRGYLGHL